MRETRNPGRHHLRIAIMKVLVVGGGGREHAIVEALHRSPGFPQFWAFDSLAGFEEFVNDSDFEFVIKPLGLTGGKGVRVWGDHFSSKAEALAYGREILEKKIGGAARFLVEEKLVGEE